MKQKSFLLAILFVISVLNTRSQTYTKSIDGIMENDLFVFGKTDRYYTNGIFFNYSYLPKKKSDKYIKSINQLELGQAMYYAFQRRIYDPSEIDRPLAGYLYLKFHKTHFNYKNQVFKYGVSFGAIGDASLAKDFQLWAHRAVFNINSTFWGWLWDFQVKTEYGLNFNAEHTSTDYEKNKIALKKKFSATVGNTFTNLKAEYIFQYGKFNKNEESAFYNARIGSNNVNDELFFYVSPGITYQGYNATVQGGLFVKDKGPVVDEIKRIIPEINAGVFYAKKRFIIQYGYVFMEREAQKQLNTHQYGKIKLGYLIK